MALVPKKANQHFIAILCGGTGPRLWPLSRADRPKQFLDILSPNSLLENTVQRAKKIVSPSHIFIVTNQKYKKDILKDLDKDISTKNIISEPQKKNTLMAMIYTSLIIEKTNPQAIISFLPSDHYIKKETSFKKQIKDSYKLAKTTKAIVLLGIKPNSINTSYGYVDTVKVVKQKHHQVTKFIEKPDEKTIKKLSSSKNLFWNSGIYTFPISTLISELQKHQPQYSINLISSDPLIAYQKCPNLSIDVGISQKSNKLLLIPSNFTWSDIGEWKAIHTLSKKNSKKISTLNSNTQFLSVESENCLVSTTPNKLIGLVGVKNLAIIDTPQGLLICDLEKSLLVRSLVGKITSKKSTDKYFLNTNVTP